jgi:hypothetical protein
LLRSQRNDMNNRERLRPRTFFRARPSSSLAAGVPGPAGLLVFVVAVFMRFLRSAGAGRGGEVGKASRPCSRTWPGMTRAECSSILTGCCFLGPDDQQSRG